MSIVNVSTTMIAKSAVYLFVHEVVTEYHLPHQMLIVNPTNPPCHHTVPEIDKPNREALRPQSADKITLTNPMVSLS